MQCTRAAPLNKQYQSYILFRIRTLYQSYILFRTVPVSHPVHNYQTVPELLPIYNTLYHSALTQGIRATSFTEHTHPDPHAVQYKQTTTARLCTSEIIHIFFHLCNDRDGFPGAEETGLPGMALTALATCCVELTPAATHVETPPSVAPPTGEPKVVGITEWCGVIGPGVWTNVVVAAVGLGMDTDTWNA
jgi:hypothetical protein